VHGGGERSLRYEGGKTRPRRGDVGSKMSVLTGKIREEKRGIYCVRPVNTNQNGKVTIRQTPGASHKHWQGGGTWKKGIYKKKGRPREGQQRVILSQRAQVTSRTRLVTLNGGESSVTSCNDWGEKGKKRGSTIHLSTGIEKPWP